mmetsp:Transcript_13441/g.39654  ORF Transcript_13441/g.39654 Transcript_13441/m.39654 type:complete len:190 (+) Transcript_13441:60-629(+)
MPDATSSDLFAQLSAALRTAADLADKLATQGGVVLTAGASGGARTNGVRGKGKKATKPPVDPDKPKRPMSAFLLYSKERRPTWVAEHPTVTGMDVTRGIADEWRNLDAAQKAPYEKRASKKMDDWRSAKEAYDTGGAGPSTTPAPYVPPPINFQAEAAKKEEKKRKKDHDSDTATKHKKHKKDKHKHRD